MSAHYTIIAFGEAGWLAQLKEFPDALKSALYANAVADALRSLPEITDAVAGIDSIVIRYRPEAISPSAAHALLTDALNKTPRDVSPEKAPAIEVPVCYGGDFGPDTDRVCNRCNTSADDLITLHSKSAYHVATLGFAPGFAYLSGTAPSLSIPRLSTPREQVTAGSIALAGGFSGIYSLPSPGGWNIIGRTPTNFFNSEVSSSFVLKPGMAIRFIPIDEKEFGLLKGQN